MYYYVFLFVTHIVENKINLEKGPFRFFFSVSSPESQYRVNVTIYHRIFKNVMTAV